MDPDIHDNTALNRYELPIDGETAVVTYNLSPPNLMITETLVPERLEGQGIASRLARHVLADAQARYLVQVMRRGCIGAAPSCARPV